MKIGRFHTLYFQNLYKCGKRLDLENGTIHEAFRVVFVSKKYLYASSILFTKL